MPQQPEVQPLEKGRPGSPEEIAGITAMLRKPEQQTTMRGYMNTVVDSMCQELIDSNGGREAFNFNDFPDFRLQDMPEYEATRTTVTGVDGVKVDGADASAQVTTAKTNGEASTVTMRFRNEGGAWKMCG
ncbi:hypothetical protein CEPID_08155 [Corynebacterium epidermidicanis]|uniref:Uncharacterized protein n=2 Tax=Corynebacterium epidermidicanis TaxID=1050174 RepID=A0A0G3GQK6_9CORY|nr:hypothetical protein CEPID_08155 [Corynebacterium epidermidicanis]